MFRKSKNKWNWFWAIKLYIVIYNRISIDTYASNSFSFSAYLPFKTLQSYTNIYNTFTHKNAKEKYPITEHRDRKLNFFFLKSLKLPGSRRTFVFSFILFIFCFCIYSFVWFLIVSKWFQENKKKKKQHEK